MGRLDLVLRLLAYSCYSFGICENEIIYSHKIDIQNVYYEISRYHRPMKSLNCKPNLGTCFVATKWFPYAANKSKPEFC